MTSQFLEKGINLVPEEEAGASGISDRQDQSVNGASAPGLYSSSQFYLQTSTQVNAAGGFNGGGIGNKSVAAFTGFDGLRLDDLILPLDYTRRDLTPNSGSPWTSFINVVVEFEPVLSPGVFKILSINSTDSVAIPGAGTPAGNPGSLIPTTLSPGVERRFWDPFVNIVEVVGGLGGLTVIAPVDYSTGGGWFNEGYLMSNLLANYPNAVIRNAATSDGGLMADPIDNGGLMLVEGDSSTAFFSLLRIESFSFNGTTLV